MPLRVETPLNTTPPPGVVADRLGLEAVPRIFVLDGDERLYGHDVDRPVTVGRHPDNIIQLLDAGVSKHHLRVTSAGARTRVVDLGSQNGTFLNGRRVSRAFLRDGDELRVGDTRLLFAVTRRAPRGEGPAVSMLPTRVGLPPSVVVDIGAAETFPPAASFVSADRLREAYERLRTTYEMVQAVSSVEDLTSLSEVLLDRALAQLPADRGALLLLDGEPGRRSLAPLAVRDVTGVDADVNITVPCEVVERLEETRRGAVFGDLLRRASAPPASAIGPARSAMAVPLSVEERVVGLLYFESSSSAEAFAARDLEILSVVARPAALALANAQLLERVAEDTRSRLALERFLSPTLVEQVRRRASGLGAEGRAAQATILFADIRGFMGLAEPMAAADVVAMLNEYFERAVEVVFLHEGVLDKFIGDGLMAVWGVPEATPDHARRAVRAAVDLRAAVEQLNQDRAARGEPELQVGVGLASGDVVAGLVGAPQRLEYTVVGHAVNVASRLCDMAGAGQILASQRVERALLDDGGLEMRSLGPRQIKGAQRPVEVLEIAPAPGAGGS